MDRYRSSRQKEVSRKQEARVAKEMGGRVEAASGATKHAGGDVRAPGYRIECKYTEKDKYALKLADLQKLRTIAFKHLEQPVMQVQFLNKDEGVWCIRRAQPGKDVPIWQCAKTISMAWEIVRDQVIRKIPIWLHFKGETDHWEVIPWGVFMEEVQNAGHQHHQ
jgi:hypothetical protein